MQRRAAAVYFILFVIIGAGAYGFIQVGMSKPVVDLDGPTYSEGDELSVDDRTYTVSGIETEDGEVVQYDGDVELTWQNESRVATATLENESTVDYQGEQFQIRTNPDDNAFTLVEQQDVEAILANDSAVENATVTQDGTEFVVYSENQTLRPLAEYLPEPQRVEFAAGDSFEYQAENVTATVDGVSEEGVTLVWDDPGEETVSLSEGTNGTLNGATYFAHFPSESQVQILPADQQYNAYQEEVETIQYWDERRNGVWGIVILSIIAAIILVATAYLPVKG